MCERNRRTEKLCTYSVFLANYLLEEGKRRHSDEQQTHFQWKLSLIHSDANNNQANLSDISD